MTWRRVITLLRRASPLVCWSGLRMKHGRPAASRRATDRGDECLRRVADTLRRGQVFSDVLARGGITGREYVAFMKATHTLNPRRMQPGLIFQLRRVKGAPSPVASACGSPPKRIW